MDLLLWKGPMSSGRQVTESDALDLPAASPIAAVQWHCARRRASGRVPRAETPPNDWVMSRFRHLCGPSA
jgi:hypothetical protein